MARTGFYAGSFDPVTYGHLDIIARAARIVDKLILGVGAHHGKQPLIDAETRVRLLTEVTKPISEHTGIKISVVTFDGLAVDAARRAHAGLLIRGLRDATDFDYEVQMSQMNGAMAPDIETVFLAASPANRMIASSLVRQIAQMGGDVTLFIPKESLAAMKSALQTKA
jgi:pantetheine-phosphate adenylyltransferase